MDEIQLAQKLEEVFGYPIESCEPVVNRLSTNLELCDPDDEDEIEELVTSYLTANIHSEIEDAEFEPDEEQSHVILARHFSGLFTSDFGYFFGDTGSNANWINMLVDLNPGNEGRYPVYCQYGSGEIHPEPVFDSPDSLEEAESIFYNVQKFYEEKPAEHKKWAEKLATEFPALCRVFSLRFSKFGVNVPAKESSTGKEPLKVIKAFQMLEPVCKALSKKIEENRNPAIDPKVLAEIRNSFDRDPQYPPFIMAAMLSEILSGNESRSTEIAKTVTENNFGVELTKTWADKIADSELFADD